jgi:uncharacterized 2Fe-2S/4Fe-4S cluster protein (DUF4445 family)
MMRMHTVVLQPSGRRGQVAEGTNLRAAARGLGVDIESICAENATCGKCKVIVEEGAFEQLKIVSGQASLSPLGAEEADYLASRSKALAARGWNVGQVRLACQAKVQGDVLVTVPEESRADKQIIRKAASERRIDIKPAIRKYLVELNPPTLDNPRADWERLARGIVTSIGLVRNGEPGLPLAADLSIDYACLRSLAGTLRESNWRVTVSVMQDREVLRVEPGYTEGLYGAAVDIGTTSVAMYLCDLANGDIIATASDTNAQITFGEDVMSRIQFSISKPNGLEILHNSIIETLNHLCRRAAKSAGISPIDILELVVVGNTTMQHLFLNLAPDHLGTAPFTPTVSGALDLKARELGLAVNGSANVHVLPAIASFIGADTTGVLLAEGPQEQDENWLIIDIGTNAELVLGNRHRLLCASTPTGPALEGAHIEFGMRAAPGAIEHLQIDPKSLQPTWKIIGEESWGAGKPKGLCGSAVVDAVAELGRAGVLDQSGRLDLGNDHSPRLRQGAHGAEYLVASAHDTSLGADMCLTQKDIRQIQLAKGALFVAAESLLDRFGISEPDKILLAGAFGSFIDKRNALAIGMLPDISPDQVFVVGNSAGDGARIALLNLSKRMDAERIAQGVVRHELPTDPEFQRRFIRAMAFPAALAGTSR